MRAAVVQSFGQPLPPPGFVTRVIPERIGGVGPWNPPRR